MPLLRSSRAIRAAKSDPPPLQVGQEFDFKIIRMNEEEKKIGLSLKAVVEDEERNRLDDYQRHAAAATSRMEQFRTARIAAAGINRDLPNPACSGDTEFLANRLIKETLGMTKADLIEEVSRVVEMTRKEAEVIVEAIFDSIVRALRSGDKIEIRGFGSFRTRQRQPRVGRNPKTGTRVEVPAKKIPYFKPSKELKDVVNGSQIRHSVGDDVRRAYWLKPPWTTSGARGVTATSPKLILRPLASSAI